MKRNFRLPKIQKDSLATTHQTFFTTFIPDDQNKYICTVHSVTLKSSLLSRQWFSEGQVFVELKK